MSLKKILYVFVVLVLLFLPSCTPKTTIFLKNCLITIDELPEGNWRLSGYVLPPVLPKDGAKSAMAIYFVVDEMHSAQNVYRYNNFFDAIFFSRFNREFYFPSRFYTWEEFEGSDQWELHADEWKIQCATTDDEFLSDYCSAVMRYGKYLTTYTLPLTNETGTYENFEDIVFLIDQKVFEELQK